MTNKILHEINTHDFNDMRSMLSELEQRLVSVDPMRQIRYYTVVQNKIYDLLHDALDATNILLYPDETNQLPTILN